MFTKTPDNQIVYYESSKLILRLLNFVNKIIIGVIHLFNNKKIEF